MKKTSFAFMSAALMTLGLTFTAAAGEAAPLKAAPGAMMYVYNLTDAARPAQDAECIDVVVDSSSAFSKGNLTKFPETAKLFGQGVFVVWKGFIRVSETGTYTFSLAFNNPGDGTIFRGDGVILQLNGGDFLAISHNRSRKSPAQTVTSRSVPLEKGDYEISVISRAPSGIGTKSDFTLRIWNKQTPLNKADITPESMVHAE